MSVGQNSTSSLQRGEESEVFSELKILEKVKFIMKRITVEPIGGIYFMSSMIAIMATQNLNLEKACYVNLKYAPEVCRNLSARNTTNYENEESEVQKLVAGMIAWKTVIQASLPSLMMLFIGSWSDRHRRRKPFMLMPVVGDLCTCIGLLFCTYYFFELPIEVAGFIEGTFPAITGTWCTMFMSIYSYIGDISSVEMRTVRVGFVSVIAHVGIPIGMSVSGILYVKIGYYGTFLLSASFSFGLLLYIAFGIPESREQVPNSVHATKRCSWVRDLIDWKDVAETLRTVFRKRSGKSRIQIILVIICGMVIIGPIYGEMAVMYLFTRYRFNWNEVDFSMFSTYSMITNLIGTMVSVGLFSHVLKIDDALIGVMSCMSKILSCFVYAFSTTDWMIYMAPIVEILNGTSFIAMRSIISKLVPPDELGKVNSLFGVCEALMPLVYGPMYSAVYAATMHTVPGAFFLLGGALTLPAVLMFLWMYMVHKRENRRIAEEEKEQNASVTDTAGPIVREKANGHIDMSSFLPASIAEETVKKEHLTGIVNNGYLESADEVKKQETDKDTNVHVGDAQSRQPDKV